MIDVKIMKQNVSMEDLLNKYGIYRNRKNYLCPFHQDKNPSASIDKNGWFHCFACGVNYDIIDFVANYEKCNRGNAIARINEMFNLGLDVKLTWKQRKELNDRQKMIRLLKEKQKREKIEEHLALNKIIKELRIWEQIEKDTHPTRAEIKNNTWENDNLFFYSLKRQKWLNWLYDKICEFEHKDCEYDYMFLCDKRELVKKVLNDNIVLLTI